MRRGRTICIAVFAALASVVPAQNVEHENVLHISYGGLWQQDQYLSPLLYSGQRVGIGNEWWQPFRCSPVRYWGEEYADSLSAQAWAQPSVEGRWSHVGRMDGQFGWTYSSAKTNLIYSLGVSGGWGAHYSWLFWRKGVQLMIGPYLNFDWLGKMHASSVNKPYSMDVALDLCVMGGVSWAFRARTTSYRLRYMAYLNMVGMDFLPDYWQSYYEITEGVPGQLRCSSLANHRMLRHELTLDMQLHHSTWRVGVKHEYVEYGERGMMFSREQVSAVIGCIWHYRIHPAKNLNIWSLQTR